MVAMLTAVPDQTYEVCLALVRARLESGDIATATAELDQWEATEATDWRIVWHRGLAALTSGDTDAALECFDEIYDLLPGEAAPKLALAASLECGGDPASAGELYRLVWRTDPNYPSAGFGLARTLMAKGDFDGAIATVESVPETSNHHVSARLAAVRIRVHAAAATSGREYLATAGQRLEELDLEPERKAHFEIQVLDAARALVSAHNGAPTDLRVLDCPLEERPLRRALETQYRTLARLTPDKRSRRDLVTRANQIRPLTWF